MVNFFVFLVALEGLRLDDGVGGLLVVGHLLLQVRREVALITTSEKTYKKMANEWLPFSIN